MRPPSPGFEPATFRTEVRRLNHCANHPVEYSTFVQFTNLFDLRARQPRAAAARHWPSRPRAPGAQPDRRVRRGIFPQNNMRAGIIPLHRRQGTLPRSQLTAQKDISGARVVSQTPKKSAKNHYFRDLKNLELFRRKPANFLRTQARRIRTPARTHDPPRYLTARDERSQRRLRGFADAEEKCEKSTI